MTTGKTLAWFHCFSGIAGDMAMGSLIDAGADLDEVRSLCERLPLTGWNLEGEAVKRCGIGGTKIHVRYDEDGEVVRTAAHILALVQSASLPERLEKRAIATVHALAAAEGHLHKQPPDMVHFHEVGSIDAIIDIVGTCAALEVLGVEDVHCSAVAQGTGLIQAAHGLLPNPAPAVVQLLTGAPTYGTTLPFEMTTPTGAALMAANAVSWGPMPSMLIEATGFGAGARDIDGQPNLTQVVLGHALDADIPGQPLVVVETNVDDITGEVLASTIDRLLEAGAYDAWVTPIIMKKGRPAYTVSALVDPALETSIAHVLGAETGSLGVRSSRLRRWPSARDEAEVDVGGRPVRVKVSAGRAKIEYDDAQAAARELELPVREVLSLAEEAWRRRTNTQDRTATPSNPSGGDGGFDDDDDPGPDIA